MELTNSFYHLRVGNIAQAIAFFRDFLQLEVEHHFFEEGSCTLIAKQNGVHFLLSEKAHHNQSDKVELKISDCIEQYCRLKLLGVVFTQVPTYSSQGLMAEFLDDFGNRYVLLESRKYND